VTETEDERRVREKAEWITTESGSRKVLPNSDNGKGEEKLTGKKRQRVL
jgi:hypothetical protein